MTTDLPDFPEIVLGTYEEFILGLKPVASTEKGKMKLIQSFASHSHKASVRCVAAHGRYLLSSGADEYINIYDMVLKEVLTTITFHNSTVTCLEFVPDGSHFVSANQNGDIAIFSCKDWTLVKYWKRVHKCSNGVMSASVHPSGSLLVTSGFDNTLRFWNLIKGRLAYAVNTSKKCAVGNTLNITKWSKTGVNYAISIGKLAEVNDTESAVVIFTTECPARVSTLEFLHSGNLVIGLETGVIQIHNVRKRKKVHEEKCHDTRIKCIYSFLAPSQKDSTKKLNYLITADSRGIVKLWRLRIRKSKHTFILKASIDVDCRITCLTTVKNYVTADS